MDIFKLFGRILISNQEANAAIDETTGKAKDLGGALEGAGTSADNTSSKMGESGKFSAAATWLGNTLYKLTEKAVELGTNLGKLGFGFNMSMESYEYSFSALLGDADKAKQLIADIQKLAKETPLGLEKLANNAVSLITSGTELEDIIPTLEMLGNLSLGDPARMDSVVRAYTQIISKGGLLAQEMYQLGDAMVPIRDIMTEFGGERYADGSWYEAKMTDPTFKIPAEDMVKAFQGATAAGGKWHDYMYTIMDSFAGMYDRLGEEGKETLGDFFKPFFEMAKSEVMPKLIESLGMFRTWISENQEPLQKLADSVGNIVNVGFDAFLNTLQWMMENGEATGLGIKAIATAMILATTAAHPYAAAITAIAGGLAWLASQSGADRYDDFFSGYSDEELQNLQAWVDAMNAMQQAWDELDATDDPTPEMIQRYDDALKAMQDAKAKVDDGLIGVYNSWNLGQDDYQEGYYKPIPMRAAEDAEASLQGDLDSMGLESTVVMNPDVTRLYNLPTFSAYVNMIPVGNSISTGSRWINSVLPGHASGLDDVPYDNYIARLHKGEAVLNSTNAEAWRSGSMGGTGRLEAMFGQMMTIMQQVAANTAGGKQVVLDSGVLVGQLAPALDTQLGTISSRKGRRN